MLKNEILFKFATLPPPVKMIPYRPTLTLADLPPNQYVNTVARVVSFKARDVDDELGKKRVFAGVLEDRTFRVPFLCHTLSAPIEKDVVLKVNAAYVHEFEDQGLLLIFSEHTKIRPQYSANLNDYLWHPRIGHLHRPVWNVRLQGIVTKIYASSGLVKRCNTCGTILYDACRQGCDAGWDWDVRIAANLLDTSGSINMILGRYLASRILQRYLSEIFVLADATNIPSPNGFDVLSFHVDVPPIEVKEAIVEDPHTYRRHESLIVSDGATRIHYPPNLEVQAGLRTSVKRLDPTTRDDFPIVRRLMMKALDLRIRQITEKPFVHGLHLLEDPLPLYRCENAHLYCGFSTTIRRAEEKIVIDATPHAHVRESVWDYLQWRRRRGASARAIKRTILRYRRNVVLAPVGYYGRIDGFLFKKAGTTRVSTVDDRDFTRFWRDVYDIDVDPNERPLVKVTFTKPNVPLTYPPSCVYFDRNVLFLTAGQHRFIEMKQQSLKRRTGAVMERALRNLRIGVADIKYLGEHSQRVDVQRLLQHDIHQKLLGRTVEATGNVTRLNDRRYFFPYTIAVVA